MVANQFKDMHDALSELRDEFCLRCKNYSECMVGGGIPCEIIDRANMALAKKPRQCDVGTAEEQAERFKDFCFDHQAPWHGCTNCPVLMSEKCALTWGQMPYTREDDNDQK